MIEESGFHGWDDRDRPEISVGVVRASALEADALLPPVGLPFRARGYPVSSLAQLRDAMAEVDVCWFGGCSAVFVRASRFVPKSTRIVCRFRADDLYSNRPARVNWSFVDGILFDSEHVRDQFERSYGVPAVAAVAVEGIDPQRYYFREHRPSFSVAWTGPVTAEGNPHLLARIATALSDIEPSYRISVLRGSGDLQTMDYLHHALRRSGSSRIVVVEDPGEGIDRWLEDKDYVLSTGISGVAIQMILAGMSKGLKPVVHEWAGASTLLPTDALFTRASEAVHMITSHRLQSHAYRSFVVRRHSAPSQRATIEDFLETVLRAPAGHS